jgi:DNA-binding response OmpR family regulator
MHKALVVEDAAEFRELLVALFEGNGFEVRATEEGETAVELARSFAPDVIVLDVGLGGMDGVEVCRRIRTFSDSYVLMLTARDEEVDRLIGLSVGADDYVTKPFYPRELLARVQALMRRPRAHGGSGTAGERRLGDLVIDVDAREASLAGHPLELTPIEYGLLDALSENPRLTLSRRQLLDRVWGTGWFGDDHVVDVHLSNLRKKLGDDPRDPRYVRTVRGFGFRFGGG